MAFPYKEVAMGVMVSVAAGEQFLDQRQFRVTRTAGVPPALKEFISEEDHEAARSYNLDKWYLGCFVRFWTLAKDLALVAGDMLPWMWKVAGDLCERSGYGGETMQSIAFSLLLFIVLPLPDIPISLYRNFVLEQKHGFNKMTMGTWTMDYVKQVLLILVFAPPLTWLAIVIDRVGGPLLPIYFLAFYVALQLFFVTIYPLFIAPLFNKYDALEEGNLKAKIEGLASSIKFPLKKLFVMDASKRSGHGNAYLFGFGQNKRIVLYDTLLDQCKEDDELIVAVLAHELGHWKHSHTVWLLVSGSALMFVQLGGFALLRNVPPLLASFGFGGAFAPGAAPPLVIAFMLFSYVVAPIDPIVTFGINVLTRSCEFQADNYAKTLGKGDKLKQGLIRLNTENKQMSSFDPLYSAYHHSHPPLLARLEALGDKKGL